MNSKDVFELAALKGYRFHYWNLLKLIDPDNAVQNDKDRANFCLIELTLIQKWLREKHNIILWVYPRYFTALVFEYSIMKITQQYQPFNSYEHA